MAPFDPPRGPWVGGTVTGNVDEFDDAGGYGSVVDALGNRWYFHCTAIADGSRTIEVGAAVQFEVEPGRLGRFEAVGLRPAAAA